MTKFDKRILSQSYTGETFLTNDNRGLIVDFYIKWRVKDPSLLLPRPPAGSEELAGQRLAEIVKDGIKSVVAQRTLQQIVSAERAAVTGRDVRSGEPERRRPRASSWSTCACSASTCRTRWRRASTRA